MKETIFVFVGEGLGVPGLPHRVTKSEAEKLGLADVLSGAIANGNYAFIGQPSQSPTPVIAVAEIDLTDGVNDNEATLAGQTLAQRQKEKRN